MIISILFSEPLYLLEQSLESLNKYKFLLPFSIILSQFLRNTMRVLEDHCLVQKVCEVNVSKLSQIKKEQRELVSGKMHVL